MGDYHEKVGQYYDQDVDLGFEGRALSNDSLHRIRSSFRDFVNRYKPKNALEIGCGPGLDAEWFGKTFPSSQLLAIDVSAKMVEVASNRTKSFPSVDVSIATEEDLSKLPSAPFDLTYVFFGALNTVPNLNEAAQSIYDSLRPGGIAVLTFVNKWYLRELLVNAIKLRFKTAFARIRPVWGGYSPKRFLESKCYSPSEVRRAFKQFKEIDHRGYSIVFPAWYNHQKVANNPTKADRLWALDEKLNASPFWSCGEYTLFVFQKSETKE